MHSIKRELLSITDIRQQINSHLFTHDMIVACKSSSPKHNAIEWNGEMASQTTFNKHH